MSQWSALIGHDRVADWFRVAIAKQKLAGSFLFVGPPGVGKTTVALLLTRTLFCERNDATAMAPCGTCPSCLQVTAGTHPDLVEVRKPADRAFIPLDKLIGPPDARMQEGFCRDVRMRPIQASRKIAIIHDADHLNEEGANCLLKTLEEPPRDALMILIATSEQKQLPTIRSRCRVIRLGPLSIVDSVAKLNLDRAEPIDANVARQAIDLTGGDLTAAGEMIDGQTSEFRTQLTQLLGQRETIAHGIDPIGLVRVINRHLESAGKDSPKKRAAMRESFAIAIAHYRSLMRQGDGDVPPMVLRRLDRSLRAMREVDRMANPSTLIECYAADISAGTTGDRGDIGS